MSAWIKSAVIASTCLLVGCSGQPEPEGSLQQGLASSWNVETDYSSSSQPAAGVWQYGYIDYNTNAFTQFNTAGTLVAGKLSKWSGTGRDSFQIVYHNITNAPYVFADGTTVPANAVVLHPGPDGSSTVARFVAPGSGTYTVNATFTGIDAQGTTTNVSIVSNNGTLLEGTELTASSKTATASGSVDLIVGDVIWFVVTYGDNGNYNNDSTQLQASITYSGSTTSVHADVEADYSATAQGNNGWEYGWATATTTGFSQFTQTGSLVAATLDDWNSANAGRDAFQIVYHNSTANPYTFSDGTIVPSSAVVLHPGPDGSFTAIRWKAPSGGTYAINATFTGIDAQNTTTGIQIASDAGAVLSRTTLTSTRKTVTATGNVTLTAGQYIYFLVDYGANNNYNNDSTRLQATIDTTTAAPPTSYNLETDYSASQQGHSGWTYGWAPTAGGAFTQFDIQGVLVAGTLDEWQGTGRDTFQIVYHNSTSSNYSFSDGTTVPAGAVVLHPGPDGSATEIRWTAPTAGSFDFSATFTGIDMQGTTTGVQVKQGTKQLLARTVLAPGNETATVGPIGLNVAVGDVIVFSVDYGNIASYSNDSTRLQATITPSTGQCGTGLTACGASCVDLNTDPANCGACNSPCAGVTNGTATCAAMTCGYTCNSGFIDNGAGACLAGYSVEGDFSATAQGNRGWSYGWATQSNGSDFVAFDTHGTLSGPVVDWSAAGHDTYQLVYENSSTSPYTFANGAVIAAGAVVLHPANNAQLTAVRWVAPTAGTFSVSITFSGVEPIGATTGVSAVMGNGTVLLPHTNLSAGSQTATATLSRSFAIGDIVYFLVDYGANANYNSDSTRLQATMIQTGP